MNQRPSSNRTTGVLRRLCRVGVALGCVAAGVSGCASASSQPAASTVRGPAPRVIPLSVRWGVFGARPMVKVRVGSGRVVPVLLDTGSTGLRIYAPAVHVSGHRGVALSKRSERVVFADGMMQRGVVGRARVTIGGMTTVRPITFGLIDTVSCDKRVPRCPGSAGIRGRIGVGEYGILGVGLTRDPGGLANPLLALARPYARRWTIELQNAGGSLILRPTFPSKPVARFRLKRDGRDPSGAAAWKDARVKVCWAAVDLRGDACEPTVFDSGSVTMLWYGGLLSHADTSIDEVLVNPGEYIAAWQPGAQTPFYSFTSGDEFSHDSVMAVHGGHPLVIAAVQTFLNFSVAYDDSRGEIALYPQSAP